MQKLNKLLLEQVSRNIKSGYYGSDVSETYNHYLKFKPGIEVNKIIIQDFYDELEKEPEISSLVLNISTYLIIVYRDLKHVDKVMALQFLNSFIEDYPNKKGSSLLVSYNALVESALASKKEIVNGNPMVIFGNSKLVIQHYNEFIGSIFSWIIIAVQRIQNKEINLNFFDIAYSKKVEKFNQLTMGLFTEFSNTAQPELRNAISHNDIMLLNDENKIIYDMKNKRTEPKEITIEKFMALAMIGSWFPMCYLASIAVCLINEEGSVDDILKLPKEYRSLLI